METNSLAPVSGNFLRRFLVGCNTPVEGLRFIRRHPKLVKFCLIPLLVNLILYLALFVVVWVYADDAVGALLRWFFGENPDWGFWQWALTALRWLIRLIVYLAVLVLSFFAFTFTGHLIAAPFNDLLSERTEALLVGKSDEGFNIWRLTRDAATTVVIELKKLLLYLAVSAVLLIFYVVPPVHLVLWGGVTLLYLALEYIDYPMSRRRLSFRERMGLVWREKMVMLGLGGVISLLLLLPPLAIFCMPVCVVGATILYLRLGLAD